MVLANMEEENGEPERGFIQRLAEAEQEEDGGEDESEEADMAMEIDTDEPERTDLEDDALAGKPTIKLVSQVSCDAWMPFA